jgi:hypothetical protein
LRSVRKLVDSALERLWKDFDQLYADTGRPSIPPERRGAVDGRTTRFGGYRASQIARERVEHPFGWIKSVAGLFQPHTT